MNKNYDFLKNINYDRTYAFIIVIFFFIISAILASFLTTYDKFSCIGLIDGDTITIEVSQYNSDAVQKAKYISIDGIKYDFSLFNLSKEYFENGIKYYLKYDVNNSNTNFVQVTFFYNKNTIFKKIVDIIF